MTPATIFDLLKKRTVLFDGAMGTELMKRGLPQGVCPEEWNLSHPDALKDIHRSYFEAGADAVSTNSFGASRIKLASYGLDGRCHELNLAAARLAGEVRPAGKFVIGDIGPTGKFLKPQGEYTEAAFEEAFAVQAEGLAAGPVDFFLIETMFDLREALSAVRGIRSVSALPVFVSMTFNRTRRGFFTLMGDSVARCVEAFETLGVPVIGANCTLMSSDLADCIGAMRQMTSKPLIAQPNAGKPELTGGDEVVYSQSVEDFVKDVPKLIEGGANIIGGCCGTNPEYIRMAAAALKRL
ncbi:MAG: homocysteine S-methyltransferase family protein [Candidatus Aminicenantes bacterium]|nr:homocysteine S-methyltransferase family protein [Candidatus Aminicenantes bacterium]